ncbi:hypothetical protein ACFPAF_16465 [Hymenobacter endophyticus]|uniref:GNAT family N-acetyltransferase n=1 Tax=Hymenobacter endophyticus TaxID=3076335 RepID=A0ABU3TKY8_9BACT|nr:hypothetical protein [Hymenobacter endophyticus]MDU0371997.1 hypothetical protein [Hymenobacter endophyticus]
MFTQKIAVHRLNSVERAALSQQMYPLQAKLFAGVDYETFRTYVVDSTAWRTWIYLHRSEQGELVGYLALHTFRKVITGKRRQIFRMETGKLPAYRGRDLTVLRVMARMLVHSLSGLRYESFFFASMVYPSSYAMAAKYAPRVWPTFTHAMPAETQALLYELADVFKLRKVSESAPLVRYVGWITREPGKKIVWNSAINPHAVYFTEQNPTYDQGHGLLTLVPASIWNICQAVVRFLAGRGRRLLRSPRN